MTTVAELTNKIQLLKSQLDAFRPFNQTQLENLRERFRIGFIQNSNAIEGNSSTLTEVKVLLEDGITVAGKTVREIKETLNHGEVMQSLDNLFTEKPFTIDEPFVLQLHQDLMRGLVEKSDLGQWRRIGVRVTGSEDVFPNPLKVPEKMKTFFSDVSSLHSLEDVAKLHFEFVKIHPFVDGNGRIARLLMNIGLISLGYFPIIIPVVLRNEYITALQGNHFDYWLEFFLGQVYENHKDYVRFFTINI
jgi:Fic family protein